MPIKTCCGSSDLTGTFDVEEGDEPAELFHDTGGRRVAQTTYLKGLMRMSIVAQCVVLIGVPSIPHTIHLFPSRCISLECINVIPHFQTDDIAMNK